jgi:ferritin-like metal-binding protein YciE
MAFAYAFERLEIGGFEQLRRVAERIGDADTAATAERILAQDCQAARDLKSAFGRAVAASLEEVGAAG